VLAGQVLPMGVRCCLVVQVAGAMPVMGCHAAKITNGSTLEGSPSVLRSTRAAMTRVHRALNAGGHDAVVDRERAGHGSKWHGTSVAACAA
jgi:hypothetical protein